MLYQFRQHSAGAARVDKGDQAVRSLAWLAIDHLYSFVRQMLQFPVYVLDQDSNMMQSLPAFFEEAGDARLIIGRLDKLQLRVAYRQKRDLNMLIRHGDSLARQEAVDSLVAQQRLVHIAHRDSGMVDAKQIHSCARSSRRSSSANPASMDDSAP